MLGGGFVLYVLMSSAPFIVRCSLFNPVEQRSGTKSWDEQPKVELHLIKIHRISDKFMPGNLESALFSH